LTKRTPGRPRHTTQTQLPPSPADVADLAEYETSQLYAGLNDFYSISGIPETLDYIREACSSVTGIQSAIQLLEAVMLNRSVLPWEFLTEISAVRGFGGPNISIYYPDLFAILTPGFWFPVLLYTTTSIFIPSLFAYFFNLTIRDVKRHGVRVSVARYTIDPLVFNIAKAIVTYAIYGHGAFSDLIGPLSVEQVGQSQLGGYQGMLIGCYVVGLASLYEAAQRRP
jgi:hypothetical protein